MSDFIKNPGNRVVLQAIVLNQEGSCVNQVAPYPKLYITRIDTSTTINILNVSSLSEDINGEYYYNWVAPSTLGFYKVRYEAIIDDGLVRGYDTVEIQDPLEVFYTVAGEGTGRFNALEGSTVILEAQVLKNNVGLFEPYSVIKVEVYDAYEKAVAVEGTESYIHLVTSLTNNPSIDGRFSYTVPGTSPVGSYFDKLFFKPTVGSPIQSGIMTYYVRKTSAGAPTPGDKETTTVVMNLFDITGSPDCNVPAYVEMNENYAFYGDDIIQRERERYFPDKNGIITMTLLETDTMTNDTGTDIFYTFSIPSIKYKKHFTIPKGTISAGLVNLPEYDAIRCV
jgi:hypothetical protein